VLKSDKVKFNVDKTSECPTQQKQFSSKINPLMRKRQSQKKEGYIWLACYNDMISNECLANVMASLPKDMRKFPQETLHLHIKDFELCYATNNVVTARQGLNHCAYPCVRRVPGKVLFVQVYLLEIRQFESLAGMLSQSL
jgi:hypothetical protein